MQTALAQRISNTLALGELLPGLVDPAPGTSESEESYLHPLARGALKKIQVNSVLLTQDNLSKDYSLVSQAMRFYFNLVGDLFEGNPSLTESPEAFDLILLEKKNQVTQCQQHFQKLSTQFIQGGEFAIAQALGTLQNKFDDLLLQFRVLKNLTELQRQNGGKESSALDLGKAEEASRPVERVESYIPLLRHLEERGAILKLPPVPRYAITPARRKKRTSPPRRRPGVNAKKMPPSRKAVFEAWRERLHYSARLALVLALASLFPLSYFLSKNFRANAFVAINPQTYASAIPLMKAKGVRNTFYGQTSESWMELPKEARKKSLRELGAMVQPEGYEIVYLVDAGNRLIAAYNRRSDKLKFFNRL